MEVHMKQWNKDKSWVFNILARWTTKRVLGVDSHPISVQHFSMYLRLSMCWSPNVWIGPEPHMHSNISLNRANKHTFNYFAKLGWQFGWTICWICQCLGKRGNIKGNWQLTVVISDETGWYLGRSCTAQPSVSSARDETQHRQRQNNTCWRQIP